MALYDICGYTSIYPASVEHLSCGGGGCLPGSDPSLVHGRGGAAQLVREEQVFLGADEGIQGGGAGGIFFHLCNALSTLLPLPLRPGTPALGLSWPVSLAGTYMSTLLLPPPPSLRPGIPRSSTPRRCPPSTWRSSPAGTHTASCSET